MDEKTFDERLKAAQEHAESIVRSFLPKEEGYQKTGLSAMNYSVLAGGKRLRPVLLYVTATMYGAKPALYEPFMAALEMIHAYSLGHDDLPALDNDSYRRGRKSTWAVYGDDQAVVAGDALLNFAYETALTAFSCAETKEETDRVVKALQLLASNAGIYGMVGGQVADLESDKHQELVDEKLLTFIQEKKTACLIDSRFVIGAILGGAPKEDIQALHQAARNVGLAFQVQDDILDVTGDAAVLGKSIGKDAAEGKATYVSLHGLDAAKKEVQDLTDEAADLLSHLSVDGSFLTQLAASLVGREK